MKILAAALILASAFLLNSPVPAPPKASQRMASQAMKKLQPIQMQVVQPFSLPTWAESPVLSVQIASDPNVPFGLPGFEVRVHAWPLQGEFDPLQKNFAVFSSGKIPGCSYAVQNGFPSTGAAQTWAISTFPIQAPYSKWRWTSDLQFGFQVP